MKIILKLASLLFVAVAFISCSTVKVTLSTKSEKVDKIAVISTYTGIQKAVAPLIDGAIVNDKVNSISNELMPMFENDVKTLRGNVATLLKSNLNCEVIYGEALQKADGFKKVKETHNFDDALNTEDEHFPKIISAPDDLNPFEFEKAKFAKILQYFRQPNNYKSTAASICQNLHVNYIAVSVSYLAVAAGNMYMRSSVIPFTSIYIFDKDGDCIASGTNYLKYGVKCHANEIEAYQQALDSHLTILEPIIKKIATKYRN